jgi:hypothetical protein
MQRLFLIVSLAISPLAEIVMAQQTATPVSDAVRSAAERAASNFVAAAEAMPPDKYGYKPTPVQMSFGEVIGHMSAGNDALCSSIGGVAPPKRPASGAQKEKLVARLRDTFQFCKSALAKADDSRLGEKIAYFGNDASRGQVMVAAAEEWAGHYSQIAVYLRLNGLLPPTAKR